MTFKFAEDFWTSKAAFEDKAVHFLCGFFGCTLLLELTNWLISLIVIFIIGGLYEIYDGLRWRTVSPKEGFSWRDWVSTTLGAVFIITWKQLF